MAKYAAAMNLFETALVNNVTKVEEFLTLGDPLLWRELIRYEFDIRSLEKTRLKGHSLVPKLLAYEIKTLCTFHMVAMLGYSDILMTFMEKDIPVDISIVSGTTPLHVACFAGHLDMVRLLIEIYKADLHKCDRYGWTALHYASTEGHLPIVKILVDLGVSVNARDQDGTTAAFRAQVNEHEEVVAFLLQHGTEDELLNIEDGVFNTTDSVAAMYAKVFKVDEKKTRSGSASNALEHIPDYSSFVSTHVNGKSAKPHKPSMFASAPSGLNRRSSAPDFAEMASPQGKSANRNSMFERSNTLSSSKSSQSSSPSKRDTVRRLIRKELEATFGSDYEKPVDLSQASISEEDVVSVDGMGVQTLTGLMREEFEKYKFQKEREELAAFVPPTGKNKDDSDYEDLYASIANLPRAPSPPPPPGAPPLPPRNPQMTFNKPNGSTDVVDSTSSMLLTQSESFGTIVDESIKKLAPKLGKDWKKLAHALPLEATPTRVSERIALIEKRNPDSVTRQASSALSQWRAKQGATADVDNLILALRRCGLHSIIPVVEKVTQEFTA